MASDKNFVEFVSKQMGNAGDISFRKMFGEYAIYCGKKVVALICDNQLFVRPTAGSKAYIGNVVEVAPYSGTKLHFLIKSNFENPDWISGLIKITEKELPDPKIKKKSKGIKK